MQTHLKNSLQIDKMYCNSTTKRTMLIAITISLFIIINLSDAQRIGQNNQMGSSGVGAGKIKSGGADKGFGRNTNGDSGNSGAGNRGPGNSGPGNSGAGNSGPGNSGPGNSGPGNSGPGSSGAGNSGAGNSALNPAPKTSVSNKMKLANGTRSWDCCKPSCGWSGKALVNKPVTNCAKDGITMVNPQSQSVCSQNGTSYLCTKFQPWTNPTNPKLAYAFVAAGLAGENEKMWCCSCYELTITAGAAKGKRLIVQAINSLADTDTNDFDMIIPGGGVGWNNYGCQNQYKAPTDGWGQRYGGVTDLTGCNKLPLKLQPGCKWRFNWFTKNVNPVYSYRRVRCPPVLTAKSGCIRTDDARYPAV